MDRYSRVCFAKWSSTDRFVLLIGPVQDVLFCLLVQYRTFCFVSLFGTRRFVLLIGPVQNALFCSMVLFPNLKLLVPNLETIGYH